MNISGQTFVVTGGCGFVGTHLVRKLVETGAGDVRVFDKAPGEEALKDTLASGRATLWPGDVTKPENLASVMDGADGLFHMAVLPLGPAAQDMRASLDINVVGSFNAFEAAHKAGVRKVVYSSASSVYGDTEAMMDESHPLDTRSMYGASKLAAELLLRAFETHQGLEYVILRYMNVYGPGQSGGLINAVLNRLRQNQPPTILGDGTQSFDFVHVSDIVQATIAAMSSTISGEAFNLGGNEEYSINQVVQFLLEMTGADLNPEYRPAPVGDVQRRVGSSDKARRLLSYQPQISFKEGLQQLVTGGFKA